MMPHLPLPAHLLQFVREQLASGRFQSESEVICTALRLLEEQSPLHEPPRAPLRSGPRERLRADDRAGNPTPTRPGLQRSPRGILADLRSDLGPEDFKQARTEMWSGFHHGATE
jgi:putative addiction module CopG family antidote